MRRPRWVVEELHLTLNSDDQEGAQRTCPQSETSETGGRQVWRGAGVTICHAAMVSAGAVVTKGVPANAVIAGAPAKFIRMTEVRRLPRWSLGRCARDTSARACTRRHRELDGPVPTDSR
jgi:hypothetical protein